MCSRLNATSVTLREWRDMDNMAPCALLLLLALVTCTSADDNDGKTVTCLETSMTIQAELSLFPGYTTGTFTLTDSSCEGTISEGEVIASTALNSCGTQVEEVGDNLVFKNKISLTEDNVITRADNNEVAFSCSYPKSKVVSLFFKPLRDASVFEEDGFGQFSVNFELFDSSTFVTAVDTSVSPFEVSLREKFYMRIKATAADNAELFVESCKATPEDNVNHATFYDIIENGCERDTSLETFDSTSLEAKLGLEAFKFIGEHEMVYITCTVILCIQGEDNTRCTQGCLDPDERRKRSVAGETARHSVIQGPLRLKKSPGEKGLSASSTPSLAFTLNVIAETLLFAVAVVCAVVAYKMKKSSTGYERFPPSEI